MISINGISYWNQLTESINEINKISAVNGINL